MRYIYAALLLGGMSACSPAIPDSGAGVGFDNSLDAQRAREAALSGSGATTATLAPPMAIASETLEPMAAPGTVAATAPVASGSASSSATAAATATATATVAATTGGNSAEDIARETAAALAAADANSGVMPLQASPSNPAPEMVVSNPGISDENDFQAVSSRESIKSDAERIARNRAQYQEVEPTALPTRSNSSQPNIVKYALGTSNPKGVQVYSRVGLKLPGRTERNCAKYASPDLAQIAFLEKGGPQRDRLGLDPDGDGFACKWDPAPYRQAVNN